MGKYSRELLIMLMMMGLISSFLMATILMTMITIITGTGNIHHGSVAVMVSCHMDIRPIGTDIRADFGVSDGDAFRSGYSGEYFSRFFINCQISGARSPYFFV